MGALVTGVQTCALPIAVVAQSRSDSSALRKRRTRAFPVALSGHRPDIVAIMARTFSGAITAVLGPTNTGKTHLAIERMCAHSSGMIGFPLRLLAREVYDRVDRKSTRLNSSH